VHFAKYQACENDFIVVVDTAMDAAQARALCHRRTGIGADGVLALERGEPWRMRIYNADGSEPEMCGNGFRCAAKHLLDRALTREPFRLATDAGVLTATVARGGGDDKITEVTVDMGPPRGAIETHTISAGGHDFTGDTVSMGNPHFVIASAAPREDAERFGHALATHAFFAQGCNIEFARFHADRAECVVYERGVGITQACGTGACAVAVVGTQQGHGTRFVDLPGGTLDIAVGETVYMTGPVAWVFDGER
jgi:diaminopimelate epimerase